MIRSVIFLLFILLISSCIDHKEVIVYYDNGAINTRYEFLDGNEYFVTNYYENGEIRSTGKIVDSTRTGHWLECFSDGVLRWEGEYPCDVKDLISSNGEKLICLDNNMPQLRVNHSYLLRIKIPEVYFQQSSISVDNGKVIPNANSHECDFLVHPMEEGRLTIILYIPYDGNIHQVKKTYSVHQ